MARSYGSVQRVIMDVISLRPMSKNQILEDTGLNNASVTNAIKALIERGYLTKDGAHYKILKSL